MTSPGWPDIVARLHDTLSGCDRDTDLELAAGPRRLHLMVRRDTVRGVCPPYDERRLAELGWQAPRGAGGWWYETPRTAEGLRWWSGFAAQTAATVLTTEPRALSCQILPPTGPRVRPEPTVPRVRAAEPVAGAGHAAAEAGQPAVEAGHAAAGAERPVAGAGQPVAGVEQPVAGVEQPVAEAGQPVAAVEQPVAGAGQPAAEAEHAAAGTEHPAAEAERPVAGVEQPAAGAGAGDVPDPSPAELPADSPAGPAADEARSGADPGAPSVLDLLSEAGTRRDLPGYLGILAAAAVCVPLAAEPGPDREVPWTIVTDPTGAPLLPVFTSPDALTAFAGEGVPFVAVPCADLLADWPDPAWGLVVDAGTPRALALGAASLAALLAANPPTG
ncbi:SseB family protein [Micromonospora sp. NPDC048868]|uniref:SseB family protein n=1 Tax=Micromonospora sp. NPDC048868 TaxID=3364258 RepID=UPI003712C29F